MILKWIQVNSKNLRCENRLSIKNNKYTLKLYALKFSRLFIKCVFRTKLKY